MFRGHNLNRLLLRGKVHSAERKNARLSPIQRRALRALGQSGCSVAGSGGIDLQGCYPRTN